MKYTNRLNLPEPIVNAIIRNDESYDRGEGTDYTVTELIKPPRQLALERKHDDQIVVDVADLIFRLLGQAVHTILERAGVPERRFTATFLGKNISGKIDRYKSGLIQDWKVTTAYRFKGGIVPEDIHSQLNFYAELLRQHRLPIYQLEAVGLLRDWSKLEVLRGGGKYPPHQVSIVAIPVWPAQHAVALIEGRIRLHEAAKVTLPDCSPGERWAKPDSWAVMKEGRKSAVRVLGTPELAEAYLAGIKKLKAAHSIVHRPGQNVRCESYCNAAPFCDQWKRLQNPPAPMPAQMNAPARALGTRRALGRSAALTLVKGSKS